MSDLSGKLGLIVGVANKRSISWAVAQAASAMGARLALTYPSERLEENVRELAATLDNAVVLPCDVTKDEQLEALGASLDQEFGGLDFALHGVAFAPQAELSAPIVQLSRTGFHVALDVSAYSLIALARVCAPLMDKRGGGSLVALTHLGSDRVFPNYNVMGVAKAALESSIRYLASELGPRGIRVNGISSGPIKTLAASGITGLSLMLQAQRERSPLKRGMELGEVGDTAAFLFSHRSRAITGEVMMVDGGYNIMGL